MQINKISFKNINNLKGEHTIDFSTGPLSEAGMFAIVGPTGSGKSTLLDVITLALFNRIPRFKKPLTKTEMEGSGSVMTRHTTSSYASVDFTVKNQLYTSKWEVSRARTGTLKDYHMDIYDHSTSEYIDLKKSEVPKTNESIIGLDYDQFIKSIILSQGQFAKFLKANNNERGLLLENITGTSIYRRLGQKAYDKNKKLKEEIGTFKMRQADVELISEEELQEINNNIKISSQAVEELTTKIKVKTEHKQLKTEALQLSATIEKLNYKLEVTSKQLNDFAREEQKLKTHEIVAPYRKEITVYDMAAYQLNEIEGNNLKSIEKVEHSKKMLAKVIEEMSTLTRIKVNEGNFFDVMSGFESKVNNLDNDLKNIRTRGAELREKINNQVANSSSELKTKLSSDISPSEAVSQLENILSTQDGLEKEPGDPDRYILETTKEIAILKDKLNNMSKIAERKIFLNELTDTIQTRINKIEDLSKNLAILTQQNTKDKELLNKFQEQRTSLQAQKEKSIKLYSLSDYRKELVDGEACPLCGALSHPYTNDLEIKTYGFDLELDKVDTMIKNLESKSKEADQAIAASTATINQLKSNNKKDLESQKAKTAELQQFLSTCKILDTNLEGLQKNIQDTYEALTNKQESLSNIAEKKEASLLLESYRELADIGHKFSTTRKERESLFKGKSASDVCNNLQTQFTDCKTSIVTHQQTITNLKMEKQNQNKIINIVKKKLTPLIRQFNVNTLPQLKSLILEKNEVVAIQQKKQDLLTENTKVQTEIMSLTEQLKLNVEADKSQESLEAISIALAQEEKQREEILTHLGTLNEKINQDQKNRDRVQEFQTELEKLSAEQEKWALLNRLIGDATGNKFANFAQGLTLQNLVVLANKRLDKLSDRYLLTKPETDGPLQIVDRYQGETKRSVSTLSGGESFMVSLALALSLSDMASKNVALDSLFIDEGFGTLDPATLDIAMNTLEKLQTESQKTVGIISHVEALKERIHTQIKLIKNAHGYARIELVG